MSGLEHLSTRRLLEEFDKPVKGKLRRKDGAPLEKGIPRYQVMPAKYMKKKRKLLDQIQLVDFGSCMYLCKWLALLFDLRKDCSSILYFSST